MPERDTILVVWMKLLTLAGKSNKSGYLLFSDNIPYNEEMISTIFNRPINSIRLAISTFKRFGMISVENGSENQEDEIFYITNWEKHQNIAAMNIIKENRKQRNTRYYLNKKGEQQLLENKRCSSFKTSYKTGVRQELDVIKTPQNKSKNKNIDIEKEKEKEIYKEKEKSDPQFPPRGESPLNEKALEVLDYLNLKTGKSFNGKNKNNLQNIGARLKDGFTASQLKTVIDKKTAEWLNDEKMNQYLNPETLFRPKKFEIYLNSKPPGAGTADENKYANVKTTHIDNVTGETWVTGG
jgi:predicted phage replisome organizer/uncharacterized phage protein (TIGR02220 family)